MSRLAGVRRRLVEVVAGILLLAYPPPIRRSWRRDYVEAAGHRWRLERDRSPRGAGLRTLRVLLGDAVRSVPAEWRRWRYERRRGGDVGRAGKTRSMAGWFEAWRWDLGIAIRGLMRRPAMSLLVVGTLALGIGANSATFDALDRVVLHPLSFDGGERAVYVMSRAVGRPYVTSPTQAEYERWRQNARSFERLEAFRPAPGVLVYGDEVDQVGGAGVSVGLAGMLAAAPVVGRMFTEEDAGDGASPVMMLAEDYWRVRMGGDPGVIGSTLSVSDVARTVVGVWPRGARFRVEEQPDFFIPLTRGSEIDRRFFSVPMGLLTEGVSPQQAEAELATLAATIEDDPDRRSGDAETPAILPIHGFVADDLVEALWILFAGVGLLIIVAGFNAANLLLNRAVDRQHELGVRLALGCGSARLVRHFLLEGGLLVGLGALLGVGVARLARGVLTRLAPADLPEAVLAGGGERTAAYAFGLVLVMTAVCSLVPAIHIRSPAVRTLVARGQRTDGRQRQRLRSVLVAAQVGLAAVLLIGSGLTVRSLQRIDAIDFGFDLEGLTIVTVRTQIGRYEAEEDRGALAHEIREALAELPGVQGVSISGVLPLSYSINFQQPYLAGEEPPAGDSGAFTQVASSAPDFLAVTGIPLLEGRDFSAEERRAGGVDVVMVNRGFASRYPESVVGRMLLFPDGSEASRIVGVVGDVRTNDIRDRTVRAQVYYPSDGISTSRSQRVLIRASGDPQLLVSRLKSRLHAVDPELLLYSVTTGSGIVAERTAGSRFLAIVLAAFAGVALVLSVAGVYGAVTLSVSRRTREIGIRMALGAWPRRLVWTVVSDVLRPVVLGLIGGVALAAMGARLARESLYEVSPRDPVTFIAAALALGAAAVLAAHLPARRATRVDPTDALRRE